MAFTTFTSYLQKNLPFDFKVLKYLQFLGITTHMKLNESHVVELAKRLPTVIPATAMNRLRTEIRIFNVLPEEQKQSFATMKVDAAWHFVRHIEDADKQQQFPVLSKLAEGCCSIFHGNADVERYFGKKHDIDANSKRSLLSGRYLQCSHFMCFEPFTIYFTHLLLNLNQTISCKQSNLLSA